ncbi:MAG: aliphatic sulfonate ABC transporter substrate-binding protein [Candidatus Rokubacteria bacterium]|nr:aliphatic sulfonate ABC transporter substrate-binding protein [Candidatus Rokubacteria bacterium]
MRRFLTLVVACVVSLTFPGFLAEADAQQPVVRFATLTSISKAPPAVVAEKRGLFDKHGVKVEMKLFAEGRVAIEALAAGQFDIGMFGDIPGLALLARGYPGKIIAAGLGGPARQAVLVRKDAPYQRLEDLKGKKLGLTKGSTDELALEASFTKRGLRWDDFTVIDLKQGEKATALQLGHVDVVEAFEPVPAIIVTKGIGRRLLTAHGEIPDIIGVIIASTKFLESHPGEVVKFLRALHEGAQWAHAYPNEMVDLLHKELKVDRPVLIDSIPRQWWYVEVFSHTLEDWQRAADLLLRLKRVAAPLDVKGLVEFKFLAEALGKKYPLGVAAADVLRYPNVTVRE